MNVAFRVDSSNVIGAGHLKRCLKLAEELRKKSSKIIFITKNFKGNFNKLITKKNFKIILIKQDTIQNDIKATKSICIQYQIDSLIMDHYYLGIDWEKKIKKCVKKFIIIDDFSDKKHFCDLIINNLYREKNNKTKNLTGLKYIIIPSHFSQVSNKDKLKKRITIGFFFGSTDKKNCIGKIIKIISTREFEQFKFIAILGKNNKNKKKIEKKAKNIKNLMIEKKFINMKSFYNQIDILVGVGGVTSFEAICNKVKCINIPINYYQKKCANFLKNKKIAKVLQYNDVFKKKNKKILLSCIKNTINEKIFNKKNNFIDGYGSKRIANSILK